MTRLWPPLWALRNTVKLPLQKFELRVILKRKALEGRGMRYRMRSITGSQGMIFEIVNDSTEEEEQKEEFFRMPMNWDSKNMLKTFGYWKGRHFPLNDLGLDGMSFYTPSSNQLELLVKGYPLDQKTKWILTIVSINVCISYLDRKTVGRRVIFWERSVETTLSKMN